MAAGTVPGVGSAHATGQAANGTTTPDDLCEFPNPEWRAARTVAGVDIAASPHCRPDNPYAVAAAVRGTNNVPDSVVMKSGYAPDAVRKGADRDGDGDPDVINITLEVNEVNGGSVQHHVAPGVAPAMWVFSPKTRGMVENGSRAAQHVRAPSPPIRVEAGDTVSVTLENTHYLPHTVHFHGVDHPYETNGTAGGDGVPQTSERPIPPGENRTYRFTPRQPGTMFYHCHVVPNVHVQMGLSGMFVVTENRSANPVQTFNTGAGQVRHPSRAAANASAEVYDLHYQALDANLTRIPGKYDDPRAMATALNRRHDATDATMDYYLLNGRSFPYTVQESTVVVEPDREYRLRVLNSGPRDIALHTHGHKFSVDAYDGVALAESNEIRRDVASVAPAQRVDLTLNTTLDGTNAYGRGVWFAHDHREAGVTTDGISPGGNVNLIAYRSYLNDSTALPRTDTDLGRYFNASYYDGELAYWAELGPKLAADTTVSEPTTAAVDHWGNPASGEMRMRAVDGGTVVNGNRNDPPSGCEAIRGTRNVTVAAGEQFAEPGSMFAYNRSSWRFDPCTRVSVTLVNRDDVRHQWMVHGLLALTYPGGMFNVEADPNATVTGTFVTPSFDTNLTLHCSVPKHDAMGMNGTVAVGTRGAADRPDETNTSPNATGGTDATPTDATSVEVPAGATNASAAAPSTDTASSPGVDGFGVLASLGAAFSVLGYRLTKR